MRFAIWGMNVKRIAWEAPADSPNAVMLSGSPIDDEISKCDT